MAELVFDEGLTASNTLQLFVDDRELKSSVAKALFRKGVVLKPVRLESGDFIVSERVALERKEAKDFEASIIDGRLFVQAGRLKNAFESPLLALVGSDFERIQPNALRGAFISLAVDFKLPVFFFDSDDELADFLYALAEKEQFGEQRMHRLQFAKKGVTLAEQQRLVVESLPGLGPKNAVSLLKHFKTLQRIANASPDDLQQVEGIGKQRAESMRKVFEQEFEQ
ncbi:hypothetical protein HY572_01420 [Candidatus Micrarchaeota archaeon]|nr:hypothetical protein [Candidatus Micrarchaeota archaeon]